MKLRTQTIRKMHLTATVRETPLAFLLILFLLSSLLISSCAQTSTKTEPPKSQNAPTNEIKDEETSTGEIKEEGAPAQFEYTSIRELWETSFSLVNFIKDPNTRAVCMATIVSDLLTSGRIDLAINAANSILLDYPKAQSLAEISEYAITNKQPDKAKKILDDLLPLAHKLQNPMEKASIFTTMIVQLNQVDEKEKASAIQLEKQAVLDAMKKNPPPESTSTDKSDEIIAAIEAAIEKTKTLADNSEYIDALNSLKDINDPAAKAVGLAYIGQSMEAEKTPLTDEMKSILNVLLNPPSQPQSSSVQY